MAVSTQVDVPTIPGRPSNYLMGAKDLTNHTRASLQTFKPTQCQTKIPTPLRICLWPNGGLSNFSQCGRAGDEMDKPVEKQKRGEKLIHVSHVVILRRKGGREGGNP